MLKGHVVCDSRIARIAFASQCGITFHWVAVEMPQAVWLTVEVVAVQSWMTNVEGLSEA